MAAEVIKGFDKYRRSIGTQRPGRCPNCRRDTALHCRDRRLVWPRISENLVLPDGACVVEDVWSCSFCGSTMIELSLYDNDREPGEASDVDPSSVRMVYPEESPRILPDIVPAEVRSLFREASVTEQADALRAAGAMYRATVEELCNAQKATGSNLYERINDLATKGVEQEVVDALHEARFLGNWSLHDGIEFAADEVADVAELIVEAVHVLYVEPEQRRAMRDARRTRRAAVRESPPR